MRLTPQTHDERMLADYAIYLNSSGLPQDEQDQRFASFRDRWCQNAYCGPDEGRELTVAQMQEQARFEAWDRAWQSLAVSEQPTEPDGWHEQQRADAMWVGVVIGAVLLIAVPLVELIVALVKWKWRI